MTTLADRSFAPYLPVSAERLHANYDSWIISLCEIRGNAGSASMFPPTVFVGSHVGHTIKEFIDHLSSMSHNPPIGDLIIGTHGGAGFLNVAMYPGQVRPTRIGHISQSILDPTKSCAIPDATLQQDPADPPSHSVHFKGCDIGTSTTLMLALKQAFGNRVFVTAPKCKHMLSEIPSFGIVEYFVESFYKFVPSVPGPIEPIAKSTMVDAFKTICGNKVDHAWIDKLIPENTNDENNDSLWAEFSPPLVRAHQNASGLLTHFQVLAGFSGRHAMASLTLTKDYPDVSQIPAVWWERKAAIKEENKNHPDLQPNGHSELSYRGFSSFDEYMDSFYWNYVIETDPSSPAGRLVAMGVTNRYILHIPYSLDTPRRVAFNFHPFPEHSQYLHAQKMVDETDARVFTRV